MAEGRKHVPKKNAPHQHAQIQDNEPSKGPKGLIGAKTTAQEATAETNCD